MQKREVKLMYSERSLNFSKAIAQFHSTALSNFCGNLSNLSGDIYLFKSLAETPEHCVKFA